MTHRWRRVGGVFGVLALVAAGSALEALCWGSLYVASRKTRTRTSCPDPSVSRTWRLQCYYGCV